MGCRDTFRYKGALVGRGDLKKNEQTHFLFSLSTHYNDDYPLSSSVSQDIVFLHTPHIKRIFLLELRLKPFFQLGALVKMW